MRSIDFILSFRQICLESELLKFFNDGKEGNKSMKSSFLFLTAMVLLTNVALGQMSTRPNPKDIQADLQKSSFQKFHERLRIGMFSVFTSPTLYDIEKGNYEFAATSPATSTQGGGFGTHTNRDTIPTNFWNQISFNYNFGAKMSFVFNPRFSVWPIRPHDTTQNPTNSFVQVEDFLVGFQGVVFSSDDKKFNLWIRPGVRLPTSIATRNSGNGGYGTTSQNLELGANPTYDFNSKWQVAAFTQWRQWVFDDRYNYTRFRFYTAPYVQYTFNDTTRWQFYYESMIENGRRWKSNGVKKDPVFKDIWQNVYTGISHDFTPKFNFFPFVGCFIDDPHFSSKSFWLGAWISYQFK